MLISDNGRRNSPRMLTLVSTLVAVGALVATAVTANAAVTSGSRLWAKHYDGPGNADDSANAVVLSTDGTTVFVTGGSDGGSTTHSDFATRAYDASTGAKRWTARYDGPVSFDDTARAIAVSPDDSTVFVTGESSGSAAANDNDYATVAYDASTGGELWVKRLNGADGSNDAPYSVTTSPDGGSVFVTGTSLSFTTAFDFVTIAYDAATGAKLWKKRYDGPVSGIDEAFSVVPSPDGAHVFVTGLSGSKHYFDFQTIAYDASTGAKAWKARYDGPTHFDDYPTAMAISPDGAHLFVTGTTTYGYRDYLTIAYDTTTGASEWATSTAGPFLGDDVGQAIAVSPDGGQVFVTGFESTIAYDASTGAEMWNELPGKLQDGRAIAVSPDGSTVYATGSFFAPTGGEDFATLAFDAATGATRWVRTVDTSGGPDVAYAVAVSPDGSTVFSAGLSAGVSSGGDYLTIAYAA
jgi:DNA-binding beta-propeller fold protein YncE